jgi:hypothetical protein
MLQQNEDRWPRLVITNVIACVNILQSPVQIPLHFICKAIYDISKVKKFSGLEASKGPSFSFFENQQERMNQSQYYMIQGSREIHHSPFYSAPSFFQFLEIWFEKSGSRNLVRGIWFEKSGSANSDIFSGSRKVVDQKNRWVYTTNPPFFRLEENGSSNSDFFLVREKWLTRKKSEFAKPLF